MDPCALDALGSLLDIVLTDGVFGNIVEPDKLSRGPGGFGYVVLNLTIIDLTAITIALFQVINIEEDVNWFRAEFEGKEGLIPSNYIEMKNHE